MAVINAALRARGWSAAAPVGAAPGTDTPSSAIALPRHLRPGSPPRTPRASGPRALAQLTGRVHAAAIRSIWMVSSR